MEVTGFAHPKKNNGAGEGLGAPGNFINAISTKVNKIYYDIDKCRIGPLQLFASIFDTILKGGDVCK